MSRSYASNYDGFWGPFLGGCLFFFFVAAIIWGSAATVAYVRDHDLRISHADTTCHLFNYTVKERVCEDSDTAYKCFDEQFFVSYSIFNGSYITSVSESFGGRNMHAQREIGNNYTCFYQWKNVNAVLMDMPDEKSSLIQLCIAFGLSGLCLLLILICLLHVLIKKNNCTCSCFSKTQNCLQRTFDRCKMTKNINQPITDIDSYQTIYI